MERSLAQLLTTSSTRVYTAVFTIRIITPTLLYLEHRPAAVQVSVPLRKIKRHKVANADHRDKINGSSTLAGKDIKQLNKTIVQCGPR